MKLPGAFLTIAILALASCDLAGPSTPRTETPPPPSQNLIENLPIADRDLLLEPLERALDDVRDAIKTDPSIPEQTKLFQAGSVRGEATIKGNDNDTVMFDVQLQDGERKEQHSWFWDQDQKLFYSAHRFGGILVGVGPDSISGQTREYRFYYEESGAKLSSYARIAAGGQLLPNVWTPVCLTREEEGLLSDRLSLVNHWLASPSH